MKLVIVLPAKKQITYILYSTYISFSAYTILLSCTVYPKKKTQAYITILLYLFYCINITFLFRVFLFLLQHISCYHFLLNYSQTLYKTIYFLLFL